MNDASILTVSRLPARLDVRQTAQLLGFTEQEIPVLVRAKLLKPLGAPAPNAHKYFSSVEILTLAVDRQWLDKASRVASHYWHNKNLSRRSLLSDA
jgi:hypothetical protein